MMYTLFMSFMVRDNILINIHQLPLSPHPTKVVYLTYQIIFKIS